MREIILDYEDFSVYKTDTGYIAVDKETGLEKEVILVYRETDITISDDELFSKCDNYDYSGEEVNSTDYLFFRLVPEKLTNEEYNVLGKLSHESKMDCWFDVREIDAKIDCVYDLEYERTMTLKDGITLLNEGLTDLGDYNLTKEEQRCYRQILKKFGIGE